MIILGSTGSIGVQALQIIKSQNLNIEVLCAGDNIALLNAQIAEFRPKIVVVKDRAKKDLVRGAKVVLCGDEGIIKALNIASSDFVLNALVGFSGVRPSLEAIRLGKRLALANKESLVVAGFLIDSAELARIIPVDSEHFALKELLDSANNSVLGMQFRTCEKFWESTDSGLVLSQNFSQIQKPHLNHFDCDSQSESTTKQTQNAESTLDSADLQNLVKNNPVRSTQISPASWCKKSESKGAEVPPADFLLEAEKRGSPPKSEKRQLLARRGSGEGGAALLREKTSEFVGKGGAESIKESQSGLPRSHSLARNDENIADSATRAKIADSALDSAPSQNLGENISSLRADSQNLRGNPQGFARAVARSNHPPIEKMQESQGGLPRATSRARNDDSFLDSAISKSIKKLFITASGGAFRDLPLSEIPTQRAESALKHPNWAMGRKITIDSASMINKVFEILEAKWLFGGRFCDFASFSQSAESRQFAESSPNIDAVIERTSTLHAIIQMQNNALLAHFSANDMRLPIASALLGAKAQNLAFVKELDLMDLNVRFEKIDCARYPLWVLKDEVLKRPKIGAIINAANDILVERFLQNQIYFGDISRGIFAVLDKFGAESMQNIDEILEINAKIKDFLSRFKGFRH